MLLLCLLPASLPAQQRSQVSGIVTDATGGVLPGAQVSVVNDATGIRRVTHSGPEGAYGVASLQPGFYKITARRDGFQTVARLGVNLEEHRNVRVDFTLPVGSMQEVITIEGGATLINMEDGTAGTVVSRDLADQLPLNSHGLQSLLDLAPGVLTTPATTGEAGQFSVNGQRANTNYFFIDGVSANTGVSGSGLPGQFAGATLPGMTAIGSLHNLASLEEMHEARVQTSSFVPEFGRMPGAQVAVLTRAGSNVLHGSIFENFRHDRLSANDWFANSRGLPPAKLSLHDFGAALGGPLRRNETFFFANLESLRLWQPYTWRLPVPSLAVRQAAPEPFGSLLRAFPLPNGGDLGDSQAELTAQSSRPSRLISGSLRLDQSLGARASLFVRYTDAPSSGQFGYFETNDSRFRWHSLTVGTTAVLRGSATNDARISAGSASVESSWAPNAVGGAQPVDLASILPAPLRGDAVYGVSIGGLGQLLAGRSGRSAQGQWYFADTLALIRGTHQVRFGLQYQRLTPSRDHTISTEVGSFNSLPDMLQGQSMLVTYGQAAQASSLIETFSAFAQDTWQVNPRLSLTYGSRWELTPPPATRALQVPASLGPIGLLPSRVDQPVWPTRYSQFAPRIGAAYRLGSQTPFVLRAGAGVFYDLGFSSALDLVNGVPYNSWQGLGLVLGPLPANTAQSLQYGFAPNLRLPLSVEWNVALERALTSTDVAALSYVGSAGRRLLRREGYLLAGRELTEQVLATNHGSSNYHALQLQYRRRMARGLRGMAAYTWSHSIDNGSWDSALMLVYPNGATLDRGSSSFDVRQSLTLAMVYDFPGLLRGWTADGILRARSGFPIDVLSTENAFGLGFDNATRPDLVAGEPIWTSDSDAPGGRRLNPGAFLLPDGLRQGSLGRNAITGLGMSQLDFALHRQFGLPGDRSLQLRLEAFNLLNHANFGDPVRFLSSAMFGESASLLNLMLGTGSPHSGLAPALQSGGPRALQLVLQFRF